MGRTILAQLRKHGATMKDSTANFEPNALCLGEMIRQLGVDWLAWDLLSGYQHTRLQWATCLYKLYAKESHEKTYYRERNR